MSDNVKAGDTILMIGGDFLDEKLTYFQYHPNEETPSHQNERYYNHMANSLPFDL